MELASVEFLLVMFYSYLAISGAANVINRDRFFNLQSWRLKFKAQPHRFRYLVCVYQSKWFHSELGFCEPEKSFLRMPALKSQVWFSLLAVT